MFTIPEAAELAGIQTLTLQMWFQRGHFSLQPGDVQAGAGKRLLSVETVSAICIAAKLATLHVPLDRAAVAGLTLAHTRAGVPPRKHVLYRGGALTMLAVRADDIRIFPISAKSSPMEIAVQIEKGATVFAVDPIFEKIAKAAQQ